LVFGDDPSNPMAFFGRYLEVTPYSRLVWTNEEGGESGPVTTVTLSEKGGKMLLVLQELYPSKEALDAAGTGAADALSETFGQLDDLLAAPSHEDNGRLAGVVHTISAMGSCSVGDAASGEVGGKYCCGYFLWGRLASLR
jgi:hypothetical protein